MDPVKTSKDARKAYQACCIAECRWQIKSFCCWLFAKKSKVRVGEGSALATSISLRPPMKIASVQRLSLCRQWLAKNQIEFEGSVLEKQFAAGRKSLAAVDSAVKYSLHTNKPKNGSRFPDFCLWLPAYFLVNQSGRRTTLPVGSMAATVVLPSASKVSSRKIWYKQL